MLYSQYSHRVASKVIANNCMILKNPTKVCSEKCPFTRGEKNICDWISCSWLCFIFQLIESEFNWWTTKNTILKENIDSWLPKTHDGVLHAWKFGCFFVCLFIWRNQRKSEAQMSTSFSTKKLQKNPLNFSSLLRVKLSHQHRYDETFPMTRMHEPWCQRNRQAA